MLLLYVEYSLFWEIHIFQLWDLSSNYRIVMTKKAKLNKLQITPTLLYRTWALNILTLFAWCMSTSSFRETYSTLYPLRENRDRGEKDDASVTAMPHYSVNADWLHFTCSSSTFQIANLLLSHCFHCKIDKYVLILKTFSDGHLLGVCEEDSEQTLKLILSIPEKWFLRQWRKHRVPLLCCREDPESTLFKPVFDWYTCLHNTVYL